MCLKGCETKTSQLLVCLVFLVLWPIAASAQGASWEKTIEAGVKAYLQGHYAEAERYLQDAVKEAERFGPQDRRLGMSLHNLAVLYEAQGRYDEAQRLSWRVLAIDENVFGPEHAIVAEDLHNLAAVYHAQRKYAEAEPLYKRALAIWEKALGSEHPNVATTLENYAALLLKTNRATEAAEMWARAKAIRAKHARGDPTK
jgi:tetratricopeptide (TPR) repeat protein